MRVQSLMGRPSNTRQRKQQIVMALLKIMAERGYEKASIQAIAKEADLTAGLIHYHFKTKQEILLELVNWIVSSGEERLNLLSQECNSAWDKLEAFVKARLATGDGARPEVVAAWVVIAGESVRQAEIKQIYKKLISQQLMFLQHLIADVWGGKSSKSTEVLHLSAIVLAAMEGAFQLSATAADVMPKNYAAQSILELIKASIKS